MLLDILLAVVIVWLLITVFAVHLTPLLLVLVVVLVAAIIARRI